MQPGSSQIITISIDAVSHHYFTGLRDQWFPKYCNYLEAHLTLFHYLPANNLMIEETLKVLSRRSIIDLEVTGIKNMGHGVAFTIEAAGLSALHQSMQQRFSAYLISKDRQMLWPHITIQNKVTAFKAKQTAELLSQGFKPFTIQATGIDTWLYLKGPWQSLHHYHFNP